jgi:hypothetical protein
MRRILCFVIASGLAFPALAHVTPNVQLVARGDFIRQALPGATKFFEKQLMIGGPDMASIRKATGWTPSEEDARVYVGRDGSGGLVGSVAFVWMPSEHGPVGIGVAFDPAGKVLQAIVTDVGSEPLAWVRPLIQGGGMAAFRGLGPADSPDPARVAPQVKGAMSRYYAEVISGGVARAQALERVSIATPPAGSSR